MRGYFGIGVWKAKFAVNTGTLWRSAFALGADFVFTVGRRFDRQAGDTPRTWRHVPMFSFVDIDDLVAHLPYSCPLVGVELHERARPLGNFIHPQRACYLLGAEDHGLSPDILARCHQLVQIPSSVCLNVATAGAIIMYDRSNKCKNSSNT